MLYWINSMVYLKYMFIALLLVQVLIYIFVSSSNENAIEIFDITEAIVNSKKWEKDSLIDKGNLIFIDLSYYRIENQLYNNNDIMYDEKNKILYHNFNFQSYSKNNLYAINVRQYHSDTLYIEYMIGKYHVGMLSLYKKNGKLIELVHNIGNT